MFSKVLGEAARCPRVLLMQGATFSQKPLFFHFWLANKRPFKHRARGLHASNDDNGIVDDATG